MVEDILDILVLSEHLIMSQSSQDRNLGAEEVMSFTNLTETASEF